MITFKMQGFTVEINATYDFDGHDGTAYILNQLSIWAGDASHQYEKEKLPGLAKTAKEFANNTYATLDNLGHYDNVK